MMIHTSFYTLVILILFSTLTVLYSADPEDPCPSDNSLHNIVADMCTNDDTVEDSTDGSKPIDSVVLRIKKQQSNCICHVSLQNNATNYTIYMSKYNGLGNSAPAQQTCGLAVDVEYQETSGTNRSLTSIECTFGTGVRPIALGGSKLILQTRIIDGIFARGYCMQIFRNQSINNCSMNDKGPYADEDDDFITTSGNQHTSVDECKRYCLQSDICVAIHYVNEYCFVYNRTTTRFTPKDGSVYSTKNCSDTQKLKIKCYPPDLTSEETTTDVSVSKKTYTVTTPIRDSAMTSFNTQSSTTTKDDTTTDKNYDLYVYIGAGAGGLLMILLIICIIVCIRKNSNQTSEKESKNYATKQLCKEDRDSDNDYGELKDNILYVSSEPNEILEDGNYNTVDLEQTRTVNQDSNLDGNYSTVDEICSNSSLSKSKPDIKPKQKTNSSLKRGSDEETIHLSTMDNSNNEYAVVDKGRNSDAVKHINPEHGNDTEYAVVNKVRKSSNNN